MSDKEPGKFYFTVEQLTETLKEFPADMPVLVSGYNSGYENFFEPYVLKMTHQPENMYFDGEFQVAEKGDVDIFKAVVLERLLRED